ncbi:alkaline phosphatase family protein [Myxococcus qinghaiensis]|uniref:alkaline phosphatase family protein n=1 Tax=Myxococcus qinghaiensis TaxID=2906758 RepID=UPI0020A807E3|nr:alkaline phosphatase family protein [Myxococcus qinghaiensis]MCP3165463.1 alkaline phosphatase family protein [Myxococcus qinghaiensis]
MTGSLKRALVSCGWLWVALGAATGVAKEVSSGKPGSRVVAPVPVGAARAVASSVEVARPSLVVFLVFDGLRYDDLERWRHRMGPGGFRRLLEGGTVFDSARYPYATTKTCPGHATLATGALPGVHGIISNEWYERESGAEVSCVRDSASPPLDDPKGKGVSPGRLKVSTLGDRLLATHGASSRVLSVSLKDRAAIMLGGHRGQAYWWGTKGFTTSRHHAEHLPPWVSTWNAAQVSQKGGAWARGAEVATYAALGPDDDARERPPEGLGRTFPHPLTTEDAFLYTPLGAEKLFEFALAGLRAEALGKRPGARDLLAIGMSSVDVVSHGFGPESHETVDMLLRLDRALAAFLESLERELGLSKVLVALSADHGMAPAPARAEQRMSGAFVTRAVDAALDQAFGPDDWVEAFSTPHLYLRQARLKARKVRLEEAVEVARKAVRALPGIADVVSAEDVRVGREQGFARRVRGEYVPERSGELVIIADPHVLLAPDDEHASTHGTPYEYDIHVPLVLFGQGLPAVRQGRPVTPLDLAPTLATWLGVTLPDASGSPLCEALAPGTPVPASCAAPTH